MSDTLALLALMNKGGSGEGITEEQVNQLIDNKNLQPKLTAGENITISNDNVISATDTGLTQEQVNTLIDSKNLQPKLTAGTNITIEGNTISSTDTGLNENEVNTLIDSKNLQPKLTAGTNITIDGNNVISSVDTGVSEQQVNTLIDSKNLQPKLTAGENITISADNVISATASGGGSSYTFTDGLTETGGTVKWDLNDRIKGSGTNSVKIGNTATQSNRGSYCVTIGTHNNDYSMGIATDSSSIGCIAGGYVSGFGTYQIAAYKGGAMAFGYSASDNIKAYGNGTHAQGYAGRATLTSNNPNNDGVSVEFGSLMASGDTAYNKGGLAAHAEGAGTWAFGNIQHVEGKCNKSDKYDIFQHITGNGSDDSNRSNAEALDWSGNRFLAGNVYVGCTDYTTSADGLVTANCGGKKLITEDDVRALGLPIAPTADGNYVLKCSIVGGVPTYSWVAEQ